MTAYREAPTFACLRCSEPLVRGSDDAIAGDGSHACPRGCGEWVPSGALVVRFGVGPDVGVTLPAWQQRTAAITCRECGAQMEARKWGSAWFESCRHGIWVDASARREMHALLAQYVESERRIAELMRELAEPGGPRALAIRLLALEQRVDKLTAALGVLEARVEPSRG